MEYKLNETFEFNGKKIKCVPAIESDDICKLCALHNTSYCNKISCTPDAREDEIDVYFVEFKEENNMPPRKLNNTENIKEQIITPPEGYEIDRENSTFECIKFKKIKTSFRNDENIQINGYRVTTDSQISFVKDKPNMRCHDNIFATQAQALSSIAMARISQIMANDERFGGVITDEEWNDSKITKHCICRYCGAWTIDTFWNDYNFLAFHTSEQCQLFIEENEDLIKQYLMI